MADVKRYWALIKGPKVKNGFELKNHTTVVLESDYAALESELAARDARVRELERDLEITEKLADHWESQTSKMGDLCSVQTTRYAVLRERIGKLADECDRKKDQAFDAMRTAEGPMTTAYQFTASAYEDCATELRNLITTAEKESRAPRG